jgi:branched-subunit amino acid aminotransferase/4-amino-4-deoxychorismate lyase
MIPIIDEKNFVEKITCRNNPFHHDYYAFYSSWLGGIIKNPKMMLIPIDDHIVHRGDGVFEGMKAVKRCAYLLEEHLQRLSISANKIALTLPFPMDNIREIILDTLRAANQDDASIRVFLSRGPGNFTANPYDSIESQLYVVITRLIPPVPEKYSSGVTIGISNIPVKSSFLAQVKSCNYLPNVLMKKESVDRQIDYSIGIDADGYITESATENIMMVDEDGILVHPSLESILKGTTMIRSFELASENGMATDTRRISVRDLQSAREVMIAGTTLNILPVVKFENDRVGNGHPGPVAMQLNELMLADIEGGDRLTRF